MKDWQEKNHWNRMLTLLIPCITVGCIENLGLLGNKSNIKTKAE